MNTMEITKIVAGICSTLLVFLLVKTGAEGIIHSGGGGHGEGHENAYVIEVEGHGEGEGEETEVVEVDFAEVMASADAAAGEGLFRACQACHKLEDGANGTGPYLYGVVGREVAAVGDFNYSEALAEKAAAGEVWDPETLSAFLANPSGWAPGTKMSYRGMRDIEDRANLIAYLDATDG